MRARSRSRTASALAAVVFSLAFASRERVAPAQDVAPDVATAAQDIESSDDFRVRVNAALVLGKMKPPGARGLLEHALVDAHPAVRTAAAAALTALGDPAAIPALERRARSESSPSAKAQMATSAQTLRRIAEGPWRAARYVVQIGLMRNRTAVRGDEATDVLRVSTTARARGIPGAIVTDGQDAGLLQQAGQRHVPILLMDGSLQRLIRAQTGGQVTFAAQVEFSLRRIPGQMLRGTLSGQATTMGAPEALGDPSEVARLEDQAIDGAVESALRGADKSLLQATK